MPAGGAHNPRCRIPFRVLAIGMVEGGETTTRAHLFDKHVNRGQVPTNERDTPLPDW